MITYEKGIEATPEDVARKVENGYYDVIIVGAGFAGSILAKELAKGAKKVLILEAGRSTSIRPEGYDSYVTRFQEALAKTPNSPYPHNPNAPQSSVLFQRQIQAGQPVTNGYQVYLGPQPFMSTFTRLTAGTSLHWLGTSMRMVPSDFEMRTRFLRGVDWPITYKDLQPYYHEAEYEIGVSADVEEQLRDIHNPTDKGEYFEKGYQYPMRQIPKTHLDKWLEQQIKGTSFEMEGKIYPLQVVGTPQGRNGMPNPKYTDSPYNKRKKRGPYIPRGGVHDPRMGQRCEGNTACVPICPVMAKYNALKTLYSADPEKVDLLTQAVVTNIEIDPKTDQVSGLKYTVYDDEASAAPGNYKNYVARTRKGGVYIIAAHAIETAKLLLQSGTPATGDNIKCGGVANSSDMVGRNLMDHPYLLTWGLVPKGTRLGVLRGPLISSEVPMRDGEFRSAHAAFRADVRNGGWDFATGAPYTNVLGLLAPGEGKPPLLGTKLRRQLYEDVQRQLSFGFEIEQLPDPANRVTIREEYRDQLGTYRPVIRYDMGEYSIRGMQAAKRLSDTIFDKVKGKDYTGYHETDTGYVFHYEDGKKVGYTFHGSGHIVGTHRMGGNRGDSVVNPDQQTWDHDNLYLVSCGNFPTIGTSNPSLTVAALAYKCAEHLIKKVLG
jgi:choline dehydrogenase-like flavoprotein